LTTNRDWTKKYIHTTAAATLATTQIHPSFSIHPYFTHPWCHRRGC